MTLGARLSLPRHCLSCMPPTPLSRRGVATYKAAMFCKSLPLAEPNKSLPPSSFPAIARFLHTSVTFHDKSLQITVLRREGISYSSVDSPSFAYHFFSFREFFALLIFRFSPNKPACEASTLARFEVTLISRNRPISRCCLTYIYIFQMLSFLHGLHRPMSV